MVLVVFGIVKVPSFTWLSEILEAKRMAFSRVVGSAPSTISRTLVGRPLRYLAMILLVVLN